MPARPETAEQIWTAILPEIRATRRRRRVRRIAAATGCAILLGCALALRHPTTPEPATATTAPPPTPPERFAVYRVGANGSVWLAEVAPDELGPTELTMELTPVVLDDWPRDW